MGGADFKLDCMPTSPYAIQHWAYPCVKADTNRPSTSIDLFLRENKKKLKEGPKIILQERLPPVRKLDRYSELVELSKLMFSATSEVGTGDTSKVMGNQILLVKFL